MTIYKTLRTAAAIISFLLACSSASTASCASKELHEAEVAMKEAYGQLLTHLPHANERQRLIAEQSEWRKTRQQSVSVVSRANPQCLAWRTHKVAVTKERAEILQCRLIALLGEDGLARGPFPKLVHHGSQRRASNYRPVTQVADLQVHSRVVRISVAPANPANYGKTERSK